MPVVTFRTCSLSTLFILAVVSLNACGDEEDKLVNLEREGIIYSVGLVEIVDRGAIFDLGDAHSLKIDDKVALFRSSDDHFRPIGLLTVAETHPTFSRARVSTKVKPRAGDVVMFVREFSQLKTPDRHRDEFIQLKILKESGAITTSTRRRLPTAMSLLRYQQRHPKWERRSNSVLGFLNGESFADGGEERIENLLNQINLFREHYRSGKTSLPSAGKTWEAVMKTLAGETANAQHFASLPTVVEDDEDLAQGPSVRDIDRQVNSKLFDRTAEERSLIAFIVSTALQESQRESKQDLWVRQQFEQSQFPTLAEEDVVLDVVRDIIRGFGDTL